MSAFVPRAAFVHYNISMANFQGHHRAGLHKINHLRSDIDLVLELRDARAPLSTVNGLLQRALQGRPKLVLYTKNDLSMLQKSTLESWHPDGEYMQVDCRNKSHIGLILSRAKDMYRAMMPPPPLGLRIMVTGMPNVGKSTFLNTLRNAGMHTTDKVVRTGGMPGITRSVSNMIRVSKDPDLFVYDSPGVFVPQVKDQETMLALSIIGAVKATHVDPVIQADYLLYKLNLLYPNGSAYAHYIPDGQPTNDISYLLACIATKIRRVRHGVVDETGTAIHWVDRWRQGKEKKILFDDASAKAFDETMSREVKLARDFKIDFKK